MRIHKGVKYWYQPTRSLVTVVSYLRGVGYECTFENGKIVFANKYELEKYQ